MGDTSQDAMRKLAEAVDHLESLQRLNDQLFEYATQNELELLAMRVSSADWAAAREATADVTLAGLVLAEKLEALKGKLLATTGDEGT